MPIFSRLAGPARQLLPAAAPLVLALALAGCASVPPPIDSMNMAQAQLQAASDAGAADYAPVDLGFARDKFQQAQNAMSEHDYAAAANLSDEARADAELAAAKAHLAAARAQIQTKVQANNTLRAQGEELAAELSRQSVLAMPAPASSSQAPAQDMPAPDSSVLAPPPAGAGFQTVPVNPASSRSGQGDQP